MSLHCIGLNHTTAPVSIRERLALDENQIRATLARCGCGEREMTGSFTELILLSTCNRTEIYAVSTGIDDEELVDLLEEISGVDQQDFFPHLYHYQDMAAARHLFRVTAGLNSMVLGEPQILGQVAQAYTLSLGVGSSSLILSRLFQSAIHAGKRSHHETEISTNPATVSSVAVHLISSVISPLARAKVLVVGAGEMAELAVRALRKRGVRQITVMNRTVERAKVLADKWKAKARAFENLEEELVCSDVVISSTGAPHTLFHREMVQRVMQERQDKPLIIMDIAVPRDVDEDVRQLAGVQLYDIDQLNDHLTRSVEERKAEIPQVEAILEEELARFKDWYRRLAIRPVIKAIHLEAEGIRRQHVDRALRRMNDAGADPREELELLTRSLVKKILHAPTNCLKEQSRNGQAALYALYARELFGLNPSETEIREDR